jgi:hypothetical protein
MLDYVGGLCWLVKNFVEREFRGWQIASQVLALFLIFLAVICV